MRKWLYAWIGIGVSVAVCLVALSAACGSLHAEPSSESTSSAPRGSLPASFSVARYPTFDEAARVAGFDIPHTLAYPLRWDTVYLQPDPKGAGVPTASAIFVGPRDTSFYLVVVPASIWPDGPPSGGLGEATLGGWEGLVLADEDDRIKFAFRCSEFKGAPMWCVVNAPELSEGELTDFLATIR